jgi:hypothetical protein
MKSFNHQYSKLCIKPAFLYLITLSFVTAAVFAQTNNRFLIIVSNPLYKTGLITTQLTLYQQDLENEGWTSTILKVNNVQDSSANIICPTEVELKAKIKEYYIIGYQGFVIIGSAPEIPTVLWSYQLGSAGTGHPTDLYYADMDDWMFKSNGMYYSYDSSNVYVGNNFTPELFYGRICAGPLASSKNEEALKVASYLNKIHNYRIHGSNLTQEQYNRSLAFKDNAYAVYKETGEVLGRCSPNNYYISNIDLSSAERLTAELEKGYKFLITTAHSSANTQNYQQWTHGFVEGSLFTLDMLNSIRPKVHFVHMFNCSACRFTEKNFGATYLFNNDYTYTVTGSTGDWGFNYDPAAADSLNNGKYIGGVIRDQIVRQIRTGSNIYGEEGWPKGILMGDPLLKFGGRITNRAPIITNKLNRLEAAYNKTFVLTFDVTDPENDPVTVTCGNLPPNASIRGTSLSWRPTWDQVGNTYPLTVNVIDNHNNSFSEDFAIYVSNFENGLLINNFTGWMSDGDVPLINNGGPPANPFLENNNVYLHTNNSWSSLKQTIRVDSQQTYRLVYWVANSLLPNNQAYISIDELGFIWNVSNRDASFTYGEYVFHSGVNKSVTLSLHNGNGKNPSTGDLYFTGLQLVKLPSDSTILLLNTDFEHGSSFPDYWKTESFISSEVSFTWERTGMGHNGSRCVKIEHDGQPNDSRWFQTIHVVPGIPYTFTGWIKGENIGSGSGASICTMGGFEYSPFLTGTFDWTKVQLTFRAPLSGIVTLGCRLGFYGGIINGTAWFDDLRIEAGSTSTNIMAAVQVPTKYEIENYPNPFNPSTTILFELPENATVKLEIYNSLGQLISVLVNEKLDAGVHQRNFNAAHLATGIYIARLSYGNKMLTHKLIFLK